MRLFSVSAKGIVVLVSVLFCLMVVPSLFLHVELANPRTAGTRARLAVFKRALIAYHKEYGQYPYSCENVEELANVLEGGALKECNSNKIHFFPGCNFTLSARELVRDGSGRRFCLIRNPDGTNMIVRSTENWFGALLGAKHQEIDTLSFEKKGDQH